MSFLRLIGYVIIVIVFNLAGLVFVCFLESRRVQREGGSSFLASLWHALVGLLKFIIAIALIVIAIYSFKYWNSTESKNTKPAQAAHPLDSKIADVEAMIAGGRLSPEGMDKATLFLQQLKSQRDGGTLPSNPPTKVNQKNQTPLDPLEKLSSSELRAMWEINAHDPELRQKIDNILNNRARKNK